MGIKKKIIIVDDDQIIHETFTAVLSPEEFSLIHVFDCQGVVDLINNEQPDLVILDIMMPTGDGRDICKEIKKNQKNKDIKVMMLSAKSEQFDRIIGVEVGADEYITKPFNPILLSQDIKRMCGIVWYFPSVREG